MITREGFAQKLAARADGNEMVAISDDMLDHIAGGVYKDKHVDAHVDGHIDGAVG